MGLSWMVRMFVNSGTLQLDFGDRYVDRVEYGEAGLVFPVSDPLAVSLLSFSISRSLMPCSPSKWRVVVSKWICSKRKLHEKPTVWESFASSLGKA